MLIAVSGFVQIVSAKGGSLAVTLVWRDKVVDDAVVDRVWTVFQAALWAVAGGVAEDVSVGDVGRTRAGALA